jgi:uncharacterized membrane protein YeaQ/YmgE (transglycosylase-associated protein family)
MDWLPIVFYGVICGALAAAAPSMGTAMGRIIAGGLTGVVAAVVLPYIRSMLGM